MYAQNFVFVKGAFYILMFICENAQSTCLTSDFNA